ncbi:MAG TPA: response regulator transcription factor [Candidatus Limnocylindrales bacterium]|nr:response regulator transcription factor [Candidatus Limnocylindrales bacterium]
MPGRWRAPHPSDEIRVVMVESRALMGIGIREVLDQAPGIEVVAHVRSPMDALPIVSESAPDVILVDVPPVETAASDVARRLLAETPGSALVVLGGEDDDASIVGAVEMGATGHVPEVARPHELVATIRAAADGDHPLRLELAARPDLVERIVADARDLMFGDRLPTGPLSSRELEVLRLVADGLRNRAIAERIGISEQTIKNHLTSILHKMGVPNRTTAVLYAVRHGWLELDEPVAESSAAGKP